ncbi:Capsular polysaccharide type 8 biosynthesis protein cap8A [uncultured Clostridium sp.]|nr:chain length determinant protein [Clostridium disporicum]SCJ88876.1 Capsular polysaccharide type 8 biosynthesis protein cap8A [uncultured Clostridium sp.]
MNEMEEQVISISEIFEAIKKRWIIIVAITLTATIISGIISFFVIDPVYEASTKVFVGKEENDNAAYNSSEINMYQQLLQTYAQAIKTKDLVNRAISGLKYDGLEARNVVESLTVNPISNTQILQIKYQSKDPNEAKDVLKSVTDEFIVTAKELVPNGNVRIIEEVELPQNPVSPNKKMNIAIAFLLGLMVSVGLVFLLEYLDNTYKNKDQLEKELGIPVLGAIPDIESI